MAIKIIVVPDGITEYHIPDIIVYDWGYSNLTELDYPVMKEFVSRYDWKTGSFNQITRSDGITIIPVYYDSPDYHLFKDKL